MNAQQPHEHVHASSAGRLCRPQKVKDTCDMCSASKVRCNKKKPICSRCERLGYPCFNSLARRVRRPRASQSISSVPDEPEAIKHQGPHDADVLNDESIETESNASEDAIDTLARDESGAATPISSSDFHFPPLSMPRTTVPPPKNFGIESTGSMTTNEAPSSSSCPQSSISTHQGADCATSAMDLLQNLDSLSPTNSDSNTKSDTLNVALGAASTSIPRLSTILSCPCSKKPDIGLLTAAVCAALLDVYEIYLHHSARSKHPTFTSPSRNDPNQIRTVRKKNKDITLPNSSSSTDDSLAFDISTETLLHGLQSRAPIMRILGELHQVADVITQFRNRYSQIGEKGPSRDLLRALVVAIASRLKAVIDEYTNSLTCSNGQTTN